MTPADLVLEPSAGTGLLAILAELAGGALCLNEFAETRAGLLALLFPGARRHPLRRGADRRSSRCRDMRPSVVLMNPPFSALAHVDRAHARRRAPPYPLGARAPCVPAAVSSPSPARVLRRTIRPGRTLSFALQEQGDRRLHGRDRRRGLCPAWHRDRDASHRHRQAFPPTTPPRFRGVIGLAPDAATLLAWVMADVPPRGRSLATARRRPRCDAPSAQRRAPGRSRAEAALHRVAAFSASPLRRNRRRTRL